MRKLYAWAGDDLTSGVEQAMQQWLDANPQNRFGPRPYSLAEYGLTREELVPVFEQYLAKFPVVLEGAAA